MLVPINLLLPLASRAIRSTRPLTSTNQGSTVRPYSTINVPNDSHSTLSTIITTVEKHMRCFHRDDLWTERPNFKTIVEPIKNQIDKEEDQIHGGKIHVFADYECSLILNADEMIELRGYGTPSPTQMEQIVEFLNVNPLIHSFRVEHKEYLINGVKPLGNTREIWEQKQGQLLLISKAKHLRAIHWNLNELEYQEYHTPATDICKALADNNILDTIHITYPDYSILRKRIAPFKRLNIVAGSAQETEVLEMALLIFEDSNFYESITAALPMNADQVHIFKALAFSFNLKSLHLSQVESQNISHMILCLSSMESLQDLSIKLDSSLNDEQIHQLFTTISEASSLKKFSLQVRNMNWPQKIDLPSNDYIEELIFDNHSWQMYKNHIPFLCACLKSMPNLVKLALRGSETQWEMSEEMGQLIEQHNSLNILAIRGVSFNKIFAKTLSVNTSITHLNLFDSITSDEQLELFLKVLEENQTIQYLNHVSILPDKSAKRITEVWGKTGRKMENLNSSIHTF